MLIPFLLGTERRQLAWGDDQAFGFTVPLEPGLYTVVVQADLRHFDWSGLYYPLTKYNNHGQMTGPWDFDLYHDHVPLLPSWRVTLDGQPLGLLYMARPTAEDLEQRTLALRCNFRVREAHTVTFAAVPHHAFVIEPLCLILERTAFDRLAEPPWAARGLDANWAHSLTGRWAELRERLRGTAWEAALVQVAAHASHPATVLPLPPEALPALALVSRIFGLPEPLPAVAQSVRHYLDLPAWGNPNPDGYGHNGDLGCAVLFKALALTYNWLSDQLPELQAAWRERLRRQGELFLDQQLLLEEYWGGAIAQDHGFRSTPAFATGAFALLGHLPEAREWLAFYVPRLQRMLRALPEDGFIPFCSYHVVTLYVGELLELRPAWHHASGSDLLDCPGLRRVPEFVDACLDEESSSQLVCTTRGDRKGLTRGLGFFMALARSFDDPLAAYLAHLLWRQHQRRSFDCGSPGQTNWPRFAELTAAAVHWGKATPQPASRPARPALRCFPDGGFISYRSPTRRWHVAVACPPPGPSFHALGTDLSGTDRIIANPSSGMFTVAVGGEPLIRNAESGYRTGSGLSNVLLIDGRGQYGDNGYTMGVPMRTWGGQRIQCCRAEPDGSGFARLNLSSAYPADLGVLHYTRDFFFAPTSVRVRDTVVCRAPHQFSYRFHTYRRNRLELVAPLRYHLGHAGGTLSFAVLGAGWQLAVAPTEVVWAYSNENESQEFVHLQVATGTAAREAQVEFVIALLE